MNRSQIDDLVKNTNNFEEFRKKANLQSGEAFSILLKRLKELKNGGKTDLQRES